MQGLESDGALLQIQSGLAERMDVDGEINISDIKFINAIVDAHFPFHFSTVFSVPQWPVAALKHVPLVGLFSLDLFSEGVVE